MLKLLALPIVVYWFWFSEISLIVAVASTAYCTAMWLYQRNRMLKNITSLGSQTAQFWLFIGAFGTVVGVPAIVYQAFKMFAD